MAKAITEPGIYFTGPVFLCNQMRGTTTTDKNPYAYKSRCGWRFRSRRLARNHREIRKCDLLNLATHGAKSLVELQYMSAGQIERVFVRLISRSTRIIEIGGGGLFDMRPHHMAHGMHANEIRKPLRAGDESRQIRF